MGFLCGELGPPLPRLFSPVVVVILLPSCLVALIVFLLVDEKTIGKEDKKKKSCECAEMTECQAY